MRGISEGPSEDSGPCWLGSSIFQSNSKFLTQAPILDKVNPSSVILSGVMMLEHMGWSEAAILIERALEMAIYNKRVTYDFERLMEGATLLKCSEFGEAIIDNMD